MTEFSQYNVLKEAVGAKLTRREPSRPDVEKMKNENENEVKEEFLKKMNTLAGSSN